MPTASNVNKELIQQRYPALLPDWAYAPHLAIIDFQIPDAEVDVSTTFGDLRDRAITALVAHRVVLRLQEEDGDLGAKYVLANAAAGGVSMAFSVPQQPEGLPSEYAHYYTTQPGIEYIELARRVIGRGVRLAQ